MTIKRRIFFSNVRMVLLSVAGFFITGFIVRMLVYQFVGIPRPTPEKMAQIRELMAREEEWMGIIMLLSLSLFAMITSIFNNFLTYRLTKTIIRPLEPLGEGVRQIHNNNLSYRIDYRGDDEFRPVCEAFNEMAARLEESAERRKKDDVNRRELVAGISHDLRTPLTSIKGSLEGLESGVASTPEKKARYFNTIKTRTADLEHIVEQLFLFSKINMDELPLAMRNVDIAAAVRDMAEEVAVEYADRGLAIRFAFTAERAFVSADAQWLRNVVINILENSARYKTKERGAVEISAALEGGFVLLRFADDGPGVAADVLHRLFDVFYRADPSRSKKGSGLGLAISGKIIALMGGEIHAENPAEGGLAVVIRLPLCAPDAPEAESA